MTGGQRFFIVVPPILWAVLIFALSSIPDLRSGFMPLWDVIVRKIAHAAEYAVLAVLLARVGYHESHRRSIVFIIGLAWLTAVTYAVMDEYHQTFVAGRHGAWLDVSVDSLGAAFGLAWYRVWRTKLPKPKRAR